MHERRGQWELADSHFCAALDQYGAAGAASELARLYGDRSRVAYRAGDLARARGLAQEALALAQSAGDAEAEAQGHNALDLQLAGATTV